MKSPHDDRLSLAEEIASAVTHGLGALASAVAGVVLITLAVLWADPWHVVGSSVFVGSLVLLYTASTLYHAAPSGRAKRRLQVVDHCAIYVLIAGTYTPFLLAGLRGISLVVDHPARQAFTVEMVGREDLLNAIALNSSIFNAARTLGPAVAGVVVAASWLMGPRIVRPAAGGVGPGIAGKPRPGGARPAPPGRNSPSSRRPSRDSATASISTLAVSLTSCWMAVSRLTERYAVGSEGGRFSVPP